MPTPSQSYMPSGPSDDQPGPGLVAVTESRRGDRDRLWTVATWSSVFVIQLVAGVYALMVWLLTQVGFPNNAGSGLRTLPLVAAGIVVVISLGIAAMLWRRGSSTARGAGLSTATFAGVLLIGAVAYVIWFVLY